MKIFVVDHPGVYLSGQTVIVAESQDEAASLLGEALSKLMAAKRCTLDGALVWREIDPHTAGAYVVNDGDY